MSTPNPSIRLSGQIVELHVQSSTLRIKLFEGSRLYVKKELERDDDIGTVSLSARRWAQMLRYLSTGQSMVTFSLSRFNRQGVAPLLLENVFGRDADRPYWTVSGEVAICPDRS